MKAAACTQHITLTYTELADTNYVSKNCALCPGG